jgi:hypothetical protein
VTLFGLLQMIRMPIFYEIRRSLNFSSGRHGSDCGFFGGPEPPVAEHRRKAAALDEYDLPSQDDVSHLPDTRGHTVAAYFGLRLSALAGVRSACKLGVNEWAAHAVSRM